MPLLGPSAALYALSVPLATPVAAPLGPAGGGFLLGGLAAVGCLYLAVWAARRTRGGEVARAEAAVARAERAERRTRLLVAMHERERERIARTLHDGPVQDLLALDMEAGVLAFVGGEAPAVRVGETGGIIRDLRAVSESLRPPTLDAFGLAAAIAALVGRVEGRHPDVRFDLALAPVALDARAALGLFRIAQEAVDNAVRHGSPRHIEVSLRPVDDGVTLSIADDGRGFDPPGDDLADAEAGRFGLLAMRAHADALAADLRVESRPGTTAVRVSVPAAAYATS